MSGPEYDDPIAHPGGTSNLVNGGRCYVCGGTMKLKDGYQYCERCMAVQRVTPAPVCEDSPLKDALDDIAGALVDTLLRKNTDYGDSYATLRREYGPVAYLIRLADKANRLKALQGHEALVSESYEDTVRDIAGYALLELVYLRGEAE